MSKTAENLQTVATNVRANLANVNIALTQATLAVDQVEPEVRDAVLLLMEKYVHGQAVIAVVQSFDQFVGLSKTKVEMETLIAAAEVALKNEAVVHEITSALSEFESAPNGQMV